MTKKTAILGIDIQNDFTSPNGSLFIRGADRDAVRTASFIDKYDSEIDYIALTMDTHLPIHIATQHYWKDNEGYPPALYSVVTANEVRDGIWFPQYYKDQALPYLEELEKNGGVCTIWPTHCIKGTNGWAINSMVMNSIFTWSINTKKTYDLYFKGMQENTEHYSIFSPQVQIGHQDPKLVKQNKTLLSKLDDFERILIMGQAADFCVVNSLNDMLDIAPHLGSKIYVVTDSMSWIIPNNERTQYLFEMARQKGVRFMVTDDFENMI